MRLVVLVCVFIEAICAQGITRLFARDCDDVWSAALAQSTQDGSRVRSTDKAGGLIVFEPGINNYPEADRFAMAYTGVDAGRLGFWRQFAMTSGQITIAREGTGCRIGLALQFAGLKDGTLISNGWYNLASNGTAESNFLDALSTRLSLSPAHIGTTTPPPVPALIIINANTSDAEITLDGKWAGNAPSRLAVSPGAHQVAVSAKGWTTWTRAIEVTAGSEVTVNAHLEETH